MMTGDEIERAASQLDDAERTRRQIRMLSLDHPGMSLDDAYAVQRRWVGMKQAAGRAIIGHKIGLTSKAMQQALAINEPDSGVLFNDMLFDDGGEIPTSRFIATRIEAELAFVLKRDIEGEHCTIFDVLNATDYVIPALEILDTRILRVDPQTGKTRTVMDTIADNAANAGIVVGGRPMRPDALDMRWVGAIVSRNAAIEETGLAAGVLNNPATGIVWLLRRLARQEGHGLKAGEVVLSGSFIRPIEARKGDTIHADFGPMGTVSCAFA
jgi:2-oxo-hept-3-ene-1,7-dioate hydratase